MTPDLKRLCEAAKSAFADDLTDAEAELIVCAVLTELREVGGDTKNYAAGLWSRRNVDAMVDDLLAKPATTSGGEPNVRSLARVPHA